MIPSTHLSVLGDLKTANQRAVAWSRFDQLYRPVIRDWALRRGLQDSDADDVVQVVLVKLLHVLPGYTHDPERARFRSWLKTVVMNEVIEHFRKKRRAPVAVGDALAAVVANIREESAEFLDSLDAATVSDPRLLRVVESVRGRIGDLTWQAFEQTTAYERAISDVADELGMTPGAVCQAKYRVRLMLNQEFAALLAAEE